MLYNIYNLLWACTLMALYNMSVAGVRIVEFGTNTTAAAAAIFSFCLMILLFCYYFRG